MWYIKKLAVTVIVCISQIIVFAETATARAESGKLPDTTVINQLLDRSFDLLSTNIDSAYLLANNALKIAGKSNYNRGIGSAYMRLGVVMNFEGNNDSALFYFHKALNIRKNLKNKIAIAASCISLSNVFRSIDNKDSAFYYLFIAVKLNEETGDSISIAQSYNTLGNLYNEYKDFNYSLIYSKRSLRIYKNMHDTTDVAFGYSGLGDYYYQKNQDTTALNYFLLAKQLDEKVGNTESITSDYNNIALCYKDLHNYFESLLYYRKTLIIARNKSENRLIAIGYSNIGILYLDTHQTDSAIFYLEKSLEMGTLILDQWLLLTTYEAFADAYAAKGDFKNAFEYNKKYSNLNDSVLNEGKIKEIADMQARYETRGKEKEIQLLNQQNKIEQIRRNILIGGCALLLLVFVISIGFFIQRQKLGKKNEQIASQRIDKLMREQEIRAYNAMIDGQEDERQRIASDLHDRLGSMLATVKMHFNTLEDGIETMHDQSILQYKRANSLLDEACDEVRKISHDLSTGMIMSFGLVAALQELCERVESSGKINFKLLYYGLQERLDTTVEVNIYRIVQELFSNILKHAQAKNVTIQLNKIDNRLTVTVEDDGIGFEVKDKMRNTGLGLKSISARVDKLSGHFTIDSTHGRGTIAIIELPIKTESYD